MGIGSQQADDTVRLWHFVGDHGPVPRLGLVRIGISPAEVTGVKAETFRGLAGWQHQAVFFLKGIIHILNVYIYIYIYIYLYVNIFRCVFRFIYIYMYIYVFMFSYMCMYIYIYNIFIYLFIYFICILAFWYRGSTVFSFTNMELPQPLLKLGDHISEV